jgi:hypothetical protein
VVSHASRASAGRSRQCQSKWAGSTRWCTRNGAGNSAVSYWGPPDLVTVSKAQVEPSGRKPVVDSGGGTGKPAVAKEAAWHHARAAFSFAPLRSKGAVMKTGPPPSINFQSFRAHPRDARPVSARVCVLWLRFRGMNTKASIGRQPKCPAFSRPPMRPSAPRSMTCLGFGKYPDKTRIRPIHFSN